MTDKTKPEKKNFRERYKHIAKSEGFKKAYDGCWMLMRFWIRNCAVTFCFCKNLGYERCKNLS